ncbi:MAG TPA: ATP synthase F0 subunit A [Actinobacteria bacterium]|nr:ATP synthase F0 subunit A [Actinomycetes bacterium]HEX21256.1 ATP synthase F0 subunit A [Actinomycetota bacterium]
MEKLIQELTPHAYYKLVVFGGVDISITKAVLTLLIAAVLTFLLFWIPSRRMKLVPRGWQNFVEVLVEFTREGLLYEIMGEEGKPYFPLIATLFSFIFITNLVGLIPGSLPATSQIGTTAAWALIVFIIYNAVGVIKHGPIGYLKTFVPPGTPIFLAPVMFPLEIISHIARPFSLAVRLFANVVAGHMVLGVFAFLSFTSLIIIKILPFSMIVIMYLFEIFVGGLQAYIFAILAAIYIQGALQSEH